MPSLRSWAAAIIAVCCSTMAIVGMIVVVIATLTGRERLDGMWKWLFFLAIFQSMLLIPKVTVTIVDRTGNEPPRAVANVPIGLGAFAHTHEQGRGLADRGFRDRILSTGRCEVPQERDAVRASRALRASGDQERESGSDQQPAGVLPGVRCAGSLRPAISA